MRRFLAAVMILGTMSGARAADMPDFLRGTQGLSSSTPNWQGFYVGGQGSWGSLKSTVPGNFVTDLQAPFTQPSSVGYRWPPLTMASQRNAGYGVFFGYNSQWDEIVLGFEGNYTHDNFHARTTAIGIQTLPDNVTVLTQTFSSATVSLPDFGSLRVRGGYMIGCFLPYAFVGVGFGQQTIDRSASATPTPLQGSGTLNDSTSKLVYGYTAGAGVDVTVIGGLFARAEYEYRRITTNIESNINTVRLGLGYKF
jgi:opacity protein-like surface antigen